jgi:hypothetical protein
VAAIRFVLVRTAEGIAVDDALERGQEGIGLGVLAQPVEQALGPAETRRATSHSSNDGCADATSPKPESRSIASSGSASASVQTVETRPTAIEADIVATT